MILRPLHINDLSFFIELRNLCSEFLHDDRKFELSDTLQWWKNNWEEDSFARSGNLRYDLIMKDDCTRVGYIRISDIDIRNKSVTIGVDIHPNYRRLGYATEVYKLLFKRFFTTSNYDFDRIQLEVLVTNEPAIALYKKLGFKIEGIRRAAIKKLNGTRVDSIIMSILKDEYATSKIY